MKKHVTFLPDDLALFWTKMTGHIVNDMQLFSISCIFFTLLKVVLICYCLNWRLNVIDLSFNNIFFWSNCMKWTTFSLCRRRYYLSKQIKLFSLQSTCWKPIFTRIPSVMARKLQVKADLLIKFYAKGRLRFMRLSKWEKKIMLHFKRYIVDLLNLHKNSVWESWTSNSHLSLPSRESRKLSVVLLTFDCRHLPLKCSKIKEFVEQCPAVHKIC